MLNWLTRRAATASAIATAAVLAGASPAVAGIWTPVASGTTASITAVTYSGPTLVYGTANGQILKAGAVKSTNPGFGIRDIAFNPAGTIGLAAATNGRLLVSVNSGETWAVKALTNASYAQTTVCAPTPGGPSPKTFTPAGNLNAVAWKDATTAYVVSQDQGVVLKTTDGATTFNDVSRQANNTCRVDTQSTSDFFTDVKTIAGTDFVWVVDSGFGATSVSSNGIASSVPRRAIESAVNCFTGHPQLALDQDSTNRAFMVDACNGPQQIGYTADGGATWDINQTYLAGDGAALTGLNDVAVGGGAALAVGNGGAILVDSDGRNAYFQRADGVDATNDWLSVAKLDANTAAVGGTGGRLLTTTQATAIPDIVAPAGTISGPTTVTAGVPATFTANVADNAGGSGIDGASFAWSGNGLPAAGGNPVTVTFPSAGFALLNVAFKDVAGNAATTSISVQVKAATVPPVVKPPSNVKSTTASVPGAKITLGTPKACVNPGSTFKVTLTWKKAKKKGNRFVKVRRADFYIGAKRVKIDKKAPFTQTLKVTASTKHGSTVTVKARAYVKVSKGKSPTKSITSTVKVC